MNEMNNHNNEEKLPPLPKGWIWTKLEDISEIILGQSPPSSTYNTAGKGLPFYQGKLEFGDMYPSPRKWCTSPKKIAEKDDVLISVRAPVGPTNICPQKSCIGRGLAAIHSLDGISPLFMLYLLRNFEDELAGKGTGTTFQAITGNKLRGFEIPLPPLPEQHRIVAKIEELFTRLDAGVKSLKKAKEQLRWYRQSVLKVAMEGKLTEEWRKQHKNELEPASLLLEKIKEERKKKLGKKYKELPPVDTEDLPELPEGWVWTRLEVIAEKITDGEHIRPKITQTGIPFLSAKDVRDEGIIFENCLYIDEKDVKRFLKRCNPENGDILIVSRGATVGRTCIVNTNRIFCLLGSVILIKLDPDICSKFISYVLKSLKMQEMMVNLSGSTAQQAIYLRDIRKLIVALPNNVEQHQIVSEIERRFSIIDEMEKTVKQGLKQAERLRQSILKRAFEGKLVPQNPDDEPASVLLERIKEEKAKSQNKKYQTRLIKHVK